MARSSFIPRPHNPNAVSDAEASRFDFAIGLITTARAKALHHGEDTEALRLTKFILALQAGKGERAPAFCHSISLRGKRYWLTDIKANGNAIYSLDRERGFDFRKAILNDYTAASQRLQTGYDRLRREHAHEVEAGESARFSAPDELTGFALAELTTCDPNELTWLLGDALEYAYLLEHPNADPWELGWEENGTGWTRYDGKVQ